LGVEKVIDLSRERSHLVGECGSKPGLPAGAHGMKASSHSIERAQPDGHLRPGSREKEGGEEPEGGHKVGREGQAGRMDLSPIDGNRHADSAAAKVCGQGNRALDDEERGSARPGNRMLVHLGTREMVRWQVQGGVPQGSRPQRRPLRLCRDLPIKTAQRLFKAGLRRWVGDAEGPVRTALETADKLAHMRLQFRRHPALDVTLEQQQQSDAGNRKSKENGRGARCQQATLEGTPLHAAARSGTM
jgi:hypothetical protein